MIGLLIFKFHYLFSRSKSAVKNTSDFDLTPKIWTIHIRTEDDIVSDSVLLILVESVDDYSNPNNPLPH